MENLTGNFDFEIIKTVLPEDWRQQAYKLGAITYSRNIWSVEDLLKLILLYHTSGKSFGTTAALTHLSLGFKMTKNAVYERFIRCGDWLSWLCVNICRNADLLVDKPAWLSDRRVCLVDATKVSLKGSRQADWGLHYLIDLFSLDTIEMHLTSYKNGETLKNFNKIEQGDVIVGDRAYGFPVSMNRAVNSGADFCFRLKSKAFNLYNEDYELFNLEDRMFSMSEGTYTDFNLFYKSSDVFVPIRLCVYRKTKDESLQSLLRVKKSNTKKMRGKVSKLQEFYSNFTVIGTSLEVCCKSIFDLYRMRWAIETLFKRLKGIFGYDEIPTKNEASSRSWLNGKLLLFAICEALVNRGRFSP
jgi:hypothetical protein